MTRHDPSFARYGTKPAVLLVPAGSCSPATQETSRKRRARQLTCAVRFVRAFDRGGGVPALVTARARTCLLILPPCSPPPLSLAPRSACISPPSPLPPVRIRPPSLSSPIVAWSHHHCRHCHNVAVAWRHAAGGGGGGGGGGGDGGGGGGGRRHNVAMVIAA